MWRYISRLQSALDTMEVEAPPRSLEEANRAVAREYGKESILTVDAWGNGYQYGVLQEGECLFMTLTSHGPDGSPGTEDDIVVRVRFWEDLDDGSCLGGNYTMSMGRVHESLAGEMPASHLDEMACLKIGLVLAYGGRMGKITGLIVPISSRWSI
jgi:hypothetical protein